MQELPETGQKTILLVEDEAMIALVETQTLERSGYRVTTVRTGEEAIETAIDDPRIDLVLMDIDLGSGIDGTVAATRILEKRDLPLIFLSSHTEPEIVERTEEITSYGYIVKNAGATVMLASIRMAFRLFESRRVYRDSFENAVNGICLHRMVTNDAGEADCLYLDINEAFENQTGLARHEVIGRTIRDLFPARDAEEIIAMYSEVFSAGVPLRREVFFDPVESWFDMSVFPTRPREFTVVVNNITDSRAARTAVEESERNYRALFDDHSAVKLIVETETLAILDANKAAVEFYGSDRATLLAMTFPEIAEQPDEELRRQLDTVSSGQRVSFDCIQRGSGDRRRSARIFVNRVEFYGRHVYHLIIIDVTDHIEAELRYSGMISGLLAHSPDLVSVFDENGVYRYVSRSMEDLFHVPPESMVGKSFHELLSPGTVAGFMEVTAELARTGVPIKKTDRVMIEKDERTYLTTLFPIAVQPDDDNLFGSIAVDITEESRNREETENSLRFLRAVIDTTQDGFWVIDGDGRIIDVNEAYCRMTGYTRDELLTLSVADIDAYETPEESALRIQRIRKQGSEKFETRHRRKSGTSFEVEMSVSFLSGEQPRIVCFGRDITQRRETERLLRVHFDAVEASLSAVALAELDGTLSYANPAFLALWGYDADDEVIGRSVAEFWTVGEDAQAVVVALREEGTWHGELVGRRKDGSSFDAEVTGVTVADDAGEPMCMMASFLDVTDRNRAAKQIRALLEEKDVLLRETHHRIKNNFLVAESLLGLQAQEARHPDTAEVLAGARSRIASMRLLYERLLDSDKYRMVSSRRYLGDVITGTIDSAVDDSAAADIALELEIVEFSLDGTKAFPLATIVVELLTNTMKYAVPSDGKRRISVHVSTDGEGAALLEYRDNGGGLPQDFRIGEQGHFGLVLARTLAEQIGGALELGPPGPPGMSATVRFPIEIQQ